MSQASLPIDGRECTKCQEFKPWTDFSKQIRGYQGHASRCKKCVSVTNNASYQERRKLNPPLPKDQPEKPTTFDLHNIRIPRKCSTCQVQKLTSDFPAIKSKRCSQCCESFKAHPNISHRYNVHLIRQQIAQLAVTAPPSPEEKDPQPKFFITDINKMPPMDLLKSILALPMESVKESDEERILLSPLPSHFQL